MGSESLYGIYWKGDSRLGVHVNQGPMARSRDESYPVLFGESQTCSQRCASPGEIAPG